MDSFVSSVDTKASAMFLAFTASEYIVGVAAIAEHMNFNFRGSMLTYVSFLMYSAILASSAPSET